MANPFWIGFVLFATPAAFGQVSLSATNPIALSRSNQPLEISAKELSSLSKDLTTLHVFDETGKELLAQAIDTDFDARHTPDQLIFQADFAPNQTRTFQIKAGAKWVYSADQFKAHGRFVRERFDDFAWENDKIAHRMYGKGLESWEGEPLTSSTLDIWSKRTPKMVIDSWYMVDNYHVDKGEGADFYSAGKSRGCGGTGVWVNNQLVVSKNFVQSRVLANGPIRILFELDYEPFDNYVETKRIALDAGSQLDHIINSYSVLNQDKTIPVVCGIGLKKVSGEKITSKPELGILSKWEAMEKNAGQQGLGVLYNPKLYIQQTQDSLNQLAIVKTTDNKADYYAGFCWDKAGEITTPEAWQKYLENFAQGVANPIVIKMNP